VGDVDAGAEFEAMLLVVVLRGNSVEADDESCLVSPAGFWEVWVPTIIS
jgi:hypothetical protein